MHPLYRALTRAAAMVCALPVVLIPAEAANAGQFTIFTTTGGSCTATSFATGTALLVGNVAEQVTHGVTVTCNSTSVPTWQHARTRLYLGERLMDEGSSDCQNPCPSRRADVARSYVGVAATYRAVGYVGISLNWLGSEGFTTAPVGCTLSNFNVTFGNYKRVDCEGAPHLVEYA